MHPCLTPLCTGILSVRNPEVPTLIRVEVLLWSMRSNLSVFNFTNLDHKQDLLIETERSTKTTKSVTLRLFMPEKANHKSI